LKKSKYSGYYNIVKNTADKEATIFIYGVIGGFDWEEWKFINTADTFLADFKAVEDEADVIHVKINSPGGNVWDGLAIFNALSNSKKTIKTYNDGICYSMGALLLLAGDSSYGNDNSLFMVHNVISAVWGNAQEMRDEAEVLDKYDVALGTAIENKLGIKASEVQSKFLNYKDNYYTSKEALDLGFYNEILKNKSTNVPDNVKDMSPKDLIEHYSKMNFETTEPEPKSNHKKPLKMSKSYPKIEAVLGKAFGEGEASNGVLLNEAEADQVEARISALETEAATAVTAKETVETSLANVVTESDALVAKANTILGLEGDAKLTGVKEAFDALDAKITALGKQPGATHTQTSEEGDKPNPHAHMDFNTPFYNTTKQLLN